MCHNMLNMDAYVTDYLTLKAYNLIRQSRHELYLFPG